MRKSPFLIVIITFLAVFVHAQKSQQDTSLLSIWEAGLPYITQYTLEDYKAHVQNWSFIQDEDGIMYVGNTSGILEFDGVSWRLIQLPNGSPAKSIAKSDDHTIYVGAVRDMGYLQPDSLGQMQFQSLLPQLDTAYQNFADIWFTYSIADTIYFVSDDYIFRWYDHAFKVWKARESFGFAFKVNNQIYVDNRGAGIMRLQSDSLILIPDGDKFSKGGITTLLPYENNNILIGHALEGLFLYDHHTMIPLGKDKKNVLQNKYVYSGTVLPNGDYAFITSGNGCFIIDKQGNIKQWLSKNRGLTSNVIIGCYVDREGSLWLATESGINRVEISSPLRVFNQQIGISEGIDRMVYHQNQLYAAAKDGLFYLKDISVDPEKKEYYFQKIGGIEQQTWDIIAKGKYILAGNFNGLYQIAPDHQIQQLIQENTYEVCPSFVDTNRVYAGTTDGHLYTLNFVHNQWRVENPRLSLEGRIIRIEENTDGSLWLSTRYNGVYKLDWSQTNEDRSFDKDYTLTHYDTSNGLPEISYNVVFQVNGENYFSTQRGIFRFDSATQQFNPDAALMRQLHSSPDDFVNMMKASADGGMWITQSSDIKNGIYKYESGVVNEVLASKRFSDFDVLDFYEQNKIIFFTGSKGIIGYNQQLDHHFMMPVSVSLRKVSVNDDSLIFGGHSSNQMANNIHLPFRRNALRFTYALSSYDNPEANQYQYFLEGFDQGWSSWTTETQRDFTNLPEGDYRFLVRGQNVYGQISEEDMYTFTILPPWYRTWWAYLLYALAFAGFVGLVAQWRSARLQREKEVLENIVKERTLQLEQQAEQLKEMDQMKSRLFANISHEFRTPLTLIKGPVDELVKNGKEKLRKSDAHMINRNADRLFRLVNQLLDLSKIDAGNLELEPEAGDIQKFLRALAAAFSSHAEQKGITYQVQISEKPLFVSFDHDKLEKIVYNLLSNAFKFTPDGGAVSIRMTYHASVLTIEVMDNGKGITSDRLPHIFDRFYQVDDSYTREQEGTGIGLALTKELVSLMDGEVTVQSEPGKGTTFTVTLPLSSVDSIEKDVPEKEAPKVASYRSNLVAEEEISITEEQLPQEAALVLIVEDNADMRSFIKAQLYKDYEILEAAHGKAGLDIARQQIPDLIITDLMMPQMDGMDLCQQLKTDECTSHIPVIMLTAKAGQEHKLEGLETGADDYLTKPFDRQELQVRVKNLITQRQQLRERFNKEIMLEPRKIAITSTDAKFLNKLLDLLENNLSDEEFGVPILQDALAMSKAQLYRKMKALTDQAPGEFIRNFRLQRAAQLLSQQGGNVTEVAYAVGFGSLSYFTRSFKELYHQSPSEYAAQKSK